MSVVLLITSYEIIMDTYPNNSQLLITTFKNNCNLVIINVIFTYIYYVFSLYFE